MNIVIFCLTIALIYGIICYSAKLWRKADIKEKMEEIAELEEKYDNVKAFKKIHKGNLKEKRKTIKSFIKE